MKEFNRRQGSPEHQETPGQRQTKPREAGEGTGGVAPPRGEQQPQGGNITKPELHPPKEKPLPFEANLPGHDEHTGDLDPKVERLMRAAAEAEAEGDPKKAERLFKRYRKDSSLIEFFKNGPTPLAYGPYPPEEEETSKLPFDDFVFGPGHLPMPGFPRKGSNSTTPEKG